MDFVLDLIGREAEIFADDIGRFDDDLRSAVSGASFLVIGGAGSIGQAVCKEIFRRNPRVLHVVDISENNMVELVRDIRSFLVILRETFVHLRWILVRLNLMHWWGKKGLTILY